MMKRLGSSLLAVLAVVSILGLTTRASADDDAVPARVTFTKDVLPILQQNCQICHREGGQDIAGMVAPMVLATYEEVRPWAKSIAKQVEAKEMPPWDPSPEFHGVFSNEITLTDLQIETLVKWVNTGAARGRPEDAPPAVEFPLSEGWVIGEPDLIVYNEAYYVPDEIEDIQPRFKLELSEEQLSEDRWIQGVQWRAGSEVVHHIVGSATLPGTEPGDFGSRLSLGSIAPGEDPIILPDGYGMLLPKGSTINMSIHFHKEAGPGTGMWDRSYVGFKFYPKGTKIKHQVYWNGISGRGLEIPPQHPEWHVGAGRTFKNDTTILSLHPHMHFRGKSMKYIAFYPDGKTETLLDVPKYDYSWQRNYLYKEPKLVPAGTRIEVFATFDNSSDNPINPDPTVPVNGGEGRSSDEMMIGFIAWCDTDPVEDDAEESLQE